MNRLIALLLLPLLLFLLLLPSCTPSPAEEEHTPFLYFSADLTPYISLPDLYLSTPIVYELDPNILPTVEEAIDDITAMHNAVTMTDQPIQSGDVITFYYRIVKDGATVENGTNYLGKPVSYTVGSGEFIAGFDELVIGLIPNQSKLAFSSDPDRLITSEDVIYANVYYSTPSNAGSFDEVEENTRLDLTDPSLPSIFRDVLIGEKEGAEIGFSTEMDRNGDGVRENVDCIVSVLKIADEIEFQTSITMPKNHSVLAGETVDLYLVVESLKRNTPLDAIDEEFLSLYFPSLTVEEGEDPNEVFAAFVERELELYREKLLLETKKTAIYRYLNENATFHAYPKGEVNYLSSLISDAFTEAFDANNSLAIQGESGYRLYASLEEYAVYYFGIESGEDYQKEITRQAQELVRHSLLAGAVITGEGLDISEDALDKIKSDYFNELARLYQARSVIFSSVEDKSTTAEGLENTYIQINGSDALEELLIYEVLYQFLLSECTFVTE